MPIHHHEKRHGLALLTAPDVTDNYALRWLAGNVAFDRPVTEVDLARAEDRLRRFGWVGVIEAFRDSLAFLCSDWGWSECDPDRFARHGHAVKKSTRAKGIAAHALRSLANEKQRRNFVETFYAPFERDEDVTVDTFLCIDQSSQTKDQDILRTVVTALKPADVNISAITCDKPWCNDRSCIRSGYEPDSYTHLTLPTILLV